MYGRDITKDKNLLQILSLLIDRGAKLDGISSHGETALRVASRVGRFDAVRLLLKAGCDRQQLEWTSLMYAIVLGSWRDVKNLLARSPDLTVRDCWQRTPWLLSIQVGDLKKVKLLSDSGINCHERGIAGKTPVMFAIANNRVEVLNWLIAEGFDLKATDESNTTTLMVAAETGATDCVRILLKAGADPKKVSDWSGQAIELANNMSIVRMLVEAGENLNEINQEMRCCLTGVGNCELEVSPEQYSAGKYRRFGKENPEAMEVDFWQAMIRSNMSAYEAQSIFNDTDSLDKPVWSYDRFGRSITELPDGRIIEIAGEHEDYYMPDFCIYNDVVVYEGDGDFQIFGYPQDVFPPTDFHTATLVKNYIYIIGSLGYGDTRIDRETPVYKLNCKSFIIEKVETTGKKPGWISRHKAVYHESSNRIDIIGGQVWQRIGGKVDLIDNLQKYTLNLTSLEWTEVDSEII